MSMQLGLFAPVPKHVSLNSVTEALKLVTESTSRSIPKLKKAELSQYFTPISIAKQMAAMVGSDDIQNIGDHGAGTGILSATLIAMKHTQSSGPYRVNAYEIDKTLHATINDNLSLVHDFVSEGSSGGVTGSIKEDFMAIAQDVLSGKENPSLDAIVLNPPYQKLNQKTELAQLFRSFGVAVPNLYAAFIVLSILMLSDGGELVAIVPRSFCNGDYYKSFRKWLLSQGSIDWFVRYNRRSNCFKGDNVLQENLIFRFTKSTTQSTSIRVSLCDNPEKEPSFSGLLPSTDVLDPYSGAIHIPANNEELSALHEMASRESSFDDIGLLVSTGKLEDNRMSDHLSYTKESSYQVPVIYSQHWANSELTMSWNDQVGKRCYLHLNDLTKKKCVPAGRYILVKRISANDDRSGRCHPCLITPSDVQGELWAIDNHIQVVSIPSSMSDNEVSEIINVMTSKTSDHFFKVISGTTQLNCNDIRKLRFPPLTNGLAVA